MPANGSADSGGYTYKSRFEEAPRITKIALTLDASLVA